MPCFRCGARQVDPEHGPSPWKKGVLAGEQVLVCPDCAARPDWSDGLDRCPACRSLRLRKALGVVRCDACGWSGPAEAPAPIAPRPATALAAEVAAAVDRVLGRQHGRPEGHHEGQERGSGGSAT